MQIEHFTLIKAEPGMALTQAADVALTDRIVISHIAISRNDSPDNWREITEEEADALRARIDAAWAACGNEPTTGNTAE